MCCAAKGITKPVLMAGSKSKRVGHKWKKNKRAYNRVSYERRRTAVVQRDDL